MDTFIVFFRLTWLLISTCATSYCDKKIVRRSFRGGYGQSVYVAFKIGVSWNKADILALWLISKSWWCNSTSYLFLHIIRPEFPSHIREYWTKIIFLPTQGWSDFAVLVTEGHVKQNSSSWRDYKFGWIHHCFSEDLTSYSVVQKKLCCIRLCLRKAVVSKGICGDWEEHGFSIRKKEEGK